jgi:hypothetical protein
MTATNHALAGALIAIAIKEPLPAIILAFIAHFILDAIPHLGFGKSPLIRNLNPKFFKVLKLDVLLAAILLIVVPLLLKDKIVVWLTFTCMFACMSPDLVWGWRFLNELKEKKVRPKNWFSKFHSWIQWSETPDGRYIEVVWFISALFIIISQSLWQK